MRFNAIKVKMYDRRHALMIAWMWRGKRYVKTICKWKIPETSGKWKFLAFFNNQKDSYYGNRNN